MSLLTGTFEVLTVNREAEFGFFLSDGKEDVLLHHLETNNKRLKVGDSVKVFLYNDHKGRIAATLKPPILTIDKIGFLEVKDYHPNMGFFLDNGIDKQLLLPISELPEEKSIWPEVDCSLLVTITHDKQERLLAALVKDEMAIKSFLEEQKAKNPETVEIGKNQFVKGIVLKHTTSGAHIYLENNQIGYLHKTERTHEIRLGEKVKVRVILKRDDGRINLSMKPLKDISRIEDADKILEVLKSRGGSMPYWDKTPPEIIMNKFNLSKAAFKRAMGKLIKDDVIYQEEGWTYLK